MITNQDIYARQEFQQWAFREDLEPGEAFLMQNYLDPRGRTLEAGSGGGRLLLAMQAMGFDDLHGFDFVPEFVATAQKRDKRQTIDFRVMDATRLDYADASFDQLVYMQQVLCFLPSEESRAQAVRQAARVLRQGGTMIVSLLSNRARKQSLLFRAIIAYLAIVRSLTSRRTSLQYLPWLRLRGKINWRALLDQGPYVYWFGESEAEQLFRNSGLNVVAVGSDHQVAEGKLLATAAEMERAPFAGRLYLVCRA